MDYITSEKQKESEIEDNIYQIEDLIYLSALTRGFLLNKTEPFSNYFMQNIEIIPKSFRNILYDHINIYLFMKKMDKLKVSLVLKDYNRTVKGFYYLIPEFMEIYYTIYDGIHFDEKGEIEDISISFTPLPQLTTEEKIKIEEKYSNYIKSIKEEILSKRLLRDFFEIENKLEIDMEIHEDNNKEGPWHNFIFTRNLVNWLYPLITRKPFFSMKILERLREKSNEILSKGDFLESKDEYIPTREDFREILIGDANFEKKFGELFSPDHDTGAVISGFIKIITTYPLKDITKLRIDSKETQNFLGQPDNYRDQYEKANRSPTAIKMLLDRIFDVQNL